ncbi:toprim domain-containing protein [Spirosoma arboris]|nr:toprim domain-containing protein [Spirosoma arboris]
MDKEHANTIPISEILGKLHLRPLGADAHIVRYPSPLDRRRQSLLWVNTLTNRWSDAHHQDRTVVDFVGSYLKSRREEGTQADALRWLETMMISIPDQLPDLTNTDGLIDNWSTLELRHKKPIQYAGLIHYLERQGISLALARHYLKEIHVRNRQTGKDFIALGFQTIDGGFALKTAYLERHLGEPAISFIRGTIPKPNAIHLFKNVMDYLSAISQLNGQRFKGDTIVLNAMSCLKQIVPYIHQYGYRTLYSWMDNDRAGDTATTTIADFVKTQAGLSHQRMNKLYALHKDVSAWHRHQLNLTL